MSEAEARWTAGDVLGGKYKLASRLGAGGMGEVWSAEHLGIGGAVAVKVLHREVARRPDIAKRFAREARAAAALRSPHVVRVFDHGFERGQPFIVMERLEGETLADRIAARGALPPRDTLRVITHVARALTCAHEAGIIHRDLKPDNVFLVPGEDGETAKLLDFGIAKVSPEIAAQTETAHTQTGSILGTPRYMSPEQLRERPLDKKSDLWALALVAFECMTGETAFSGHALAEVINDVLSGPIPVPSKRAPVPAGFDAWFRRAASRDPKRRFESARQMVDALAEVVEADKPLTYEPAPRPVTTTEALTLSGTQSQTDVPAQSSGRTRLFVALAATLAGAGVLWMATRKDDAPQTATSVPATAVASSPSNAALPSAAAEPPAVQASVAPSSPEPETTMTVPSSDATASKSASSRPVSGTPKQPGARPSVAPSASSAPTAPPSATNNVLAF